LRKSAWEARCQKQARLGLWALGLKKPRVPEYYGTHAAGATEPEDALPLSCQVLQDFDGLEDLRSAWDEAVATAEGSVYMTYDWVRLWWEFYGGTAELKLFLFWSAERLVSVVPMYVETLGAGPFHFRVARLIGANIPPRVFNPPAPEPYAAAVFEQILTELFTRCNCDFMSFGPISESEGRSAAIASACARLESHVEQRKPSKTVNTAYELPANMAEYYQGLSKNERKRRKKFELRSLKNEYPDARVESVGDPAMVLAEFDRFVEQHRKQWFVKGKLGHFGSWPRAMEFHRSVVAAQARLGRVRFFRIVADGQVVASKYLFVFGGRYYAELNARSMDPKWERFSLGPSGAVAVIEQGIAEGMKRIESGLEHYDHKARLGAKEYPAITVRVVHSRLRSRICFALFSLLRGCMSVGYHKLWYRRISPRLPRFFWRPQWRPWLRLDF
jgi:CelD/BcsL family acetyltransferase involved in cellulose biosynthesis